MCVYTGIITSLPFLDTTTLLLLITTICSVLHSSIADASLHPPYKVHTEDGALHTHEPSLNDQQIDLQTLGATNSYSLNTEDEGDTIQIIWVNSSVHEISISWKLIEAYNVTGFIKHSVVEYFPVGGRFTSHPLQRDVRNYTFVNLDPGTIYTICVYMTEVFGTNNATSKSHSRCVKINTIEYIRRDSVVIMLITLGYYAFMGLIGYTQWRKRLYFIASRSKNRSRTKDNEALGEQTNSAMRWKDLAEREKLMTTKPGCSIECNDT